MYNIYILISNGFLKCLCNEKFNSVFMTPLDTSWCAESHGAVSFFNYGKGRYCNPRSNINIFIPKMSGIWDRIRSRHTLESCLVDLTFLIVYVIVFYFSLFTTLTCDVTEAIWPRGEVNKICVIFTVFSHQEVPSWFIKTQSNFSLHRHFKTFEKKVWQ